MTLLTIFKLYLNYQQVMKIETDIITSDAAIPIGLAMKLMIMFVGTFKTDQ
jgi:hypothetical protein